VDECKPLILGWISDFPDELPDTSTDHGMAVQVASMEPQVETAWN